MLLMNKGLFFDQTKWYSTQKKRLFQMAYLKFHKKNYWESSKLTDSKINPSRENHAHFISCKLPHKNHPREYFGLTLWFIQIATSVVEKSQILSVVFHLSTTVCPSGSPRSQEKHVSGLSKHHCPWPSTSNSSLSASIPTICPWSAPSQNACFTSMSLKKAAPLLNPSHDPCSNACFQTRPNGESGDNVVRAMSFAMLSSVVGGGGDDVAVVFNADTGAGGDTAGGAWITGFFFNVVFFSSIVTYGESQWCHKAWHMGNRCGNEDGEAVRHMT